ncbi:transcriptional regulator family: Fungal Specific TF [Aspergillus niger]|nr:transcriptional regulator family: Fungal Specific TF [Aspergillus niger]
MPRVAIFRCFGATGPRSRGPGRSELATLFVQHEAIVNIPFSAEFNMSSPSAQETIQERRHRLSLVPRACEGCKVRKIRCDRKIPCSNCQASKITCRHPNDRTRNQLQADRIAHLFENILALTMGMVKAQGEAKPSLYWRLVSAAAAHCQSLGYHRETTYRNILSGKADNIRRLFWTVYIFDKNMSLLLGRVSNMQGVMIDVRYPAISSDLGRRAWDESFIMGIRLAEFQDRIFTSLYNAATSIEDASERARLISDLESAMEQWHLELKQINPEGVNNILVFKLSRTNWDISFYSTLTLLLHASSKTGEESQISSRCFNAARNSLLAHLNSFPQYQSSKLLSDGEYFNWILLFSSLTPFLVIFLHAISEKDTESVGLLSQVVGTFETFRKVSHGAERLYQVRTTFTNIAEKIIQSQQSSVGIYDQQGSSLRLPDTPGSMTRFHPEDLQDMLDIENGDRATSLYASDLLNEFLSGEPFSWNRFDYDIGNGQ